MLDNVHEQATDIGDEAATTMLSLSDIGTLLTFQLELGLHLEDSLCPQRPRERPSHRT